MFALIIIFYRFNPTDRQNVSIITTVGVIEAAHGDDFTTTPTESRLQFQNAERLPLSIDECLAKVEELERTCHNYMRQYRQAFIGEIIHEVETNA